MRRRVVLAILLVLFGVLGYSLFRRHSGERAGDARAEAVEGSQESGSGADTPEEGAAASNSGASDKPQETASGDAGQADTGVADEPTLERPMRVVSSGWDLIAPGVVANGGPSTADGSAYADRGFELDFRVVDGADGIRDALARGGEQKEGADVAILPLPAFAASYEKLRALKPKVFFVTGWSKGREGIATRSDEALTDPDDDDEYNLRGIPGESATFLSLFFMDLAGIPLEDVDIDENAGGVDLEYAAVARAESSLDAIPDGLRVRISTADAVQAIPVVAITSKGFIDRHQRTLDAWAQGWLEGTETLESDVPGAARTIASKADDIDALELIDLLGWVSFATPRENAEMVGLSGRSAVNLEHLFQIAWRVWREAGVITSPSPQAMPISTTTIVGLVQSELRGSSEESGEIESTDDVLLVHRQPDLDEEEFVEQIGLLAGLFERSKIEVTVNWNRSKSEEMIEQASERFDISQSRLERGRAVPGSGEASIEVFKVK
jgi:ABC-type nitrate/sulfonate/bicarbonate transport system substrate-binding protein